MKQNTYDIVIKNCRVIDGTGNPWYNADIGINKDRIAFIGRIEETAKKIIEAEGLIVSPGFIDTHSHSDLMLLAEPKAKQKVMQGITTEVIGQDGLGEAPIIDEVLDDWRRYLSGLNGDPDIEWNWRTFDEYLNALEFTKTATNVVALVGHGNLRLLTLGMENRDPTPSELSEMKMLLAQTLEEGAFGLSTGLIYPPCVYADTNELVELCKVTAEHGGIFVVHMRNEGDQLLESIDEVAEIGLKSGVHLHISHFKASGRLNWGKSKDALRKLTEYRRKDIEISFDQYPYIAGSTFLSSLLPVWTHEGGTERMLNRLRDHEIRERISNEMIEKGRGQDWGWNNILVTSVRTPANKDLEGVNLHEIAKIRSQSVLESLFDIIMEEDNAVTMASFSMSEEDVETIMRSSLQMVCTDGIALGKPHPRAYGSFPRIIGRYVKKKVLSLEEAIRKMTFMPAQTFKLTDRGCLKPGMYADITIFDPKKIIDKGTFQNPTQFPEGIEYVIVNGKITVEKNIQTIERAGMVLRRS